MRRFVPIYLWLRASPAFLNGIIMEKQTLLVVEDDPKIRTLLRNVLEGEGYSVLLSDDGEEVLELVGNRRIDLITLDIHLGSRNGLDLAREILR